jgi:hypothetical protein
VYVSVDEPFVYIYHAEGTWYIGDRDQLGYVYAKLDSDEQSVVQLGQSSWSVHTGQTWTIIDVSIDCDSKYIYVTKVMLQKHNFLNCESNIMEYW